MSPAAPESKVDIVELSWLKPHEEIVPERVDELTRQFERRGSVDYAIVADLHSGTIIDGHHRHATLRRLGATRAPVVLVDYEDDAIRVSAWREDEAAPTKDEIVAHARAGKLYPPKTTRHDFVRVLDPIDIPLGDLGVAATRSV